LLGAFVTLSFCDASPIPDEAYDEAGLTEAVDAVFRKLSNIKLGWVLITCAQVPAQPTL
jgi:hypothetical protein